MQRLIKITNRRASRSFLTRTCGQVMNTSPSWRNGWYHDVLAFHAGELSADDLLKKAGQSRLNLCEAYHYIAHRKLAEGDRAGARDYYQRSYDTGVYTYGEYQFSRAIIKVMDADPNWLPAVRGRKPAKTEPMK